MYYNPSVYAHTISGGIFLVSVLYLALYFSKISSKDSYQILILILMFSVVMGIHGISHIGLEYMYGYNPYFPIIGKTIEPYHPLDCPCRLHHRNCPFYRNPE